MAASQFTLDPADPGTLGQPVASVSTSIPIWKELASITESGRRASGRDETNTDTDTNIMFHAAASAARDRRHEMKQLQTAPADTRSRASKQVSRALVNLQLAYAPLRRKLQSAGPGLPISSTHCTKVPQEPRCVRSLLRICHWLPASPSRRRVADAGGVDGGLLHLHLHLHPISSPIVT
ncbi:hypothetical protein CMUS01_08238 [Colletotrichum musicola]|uniref:Uncharacterized protein n=1 Tax=Colletotrichum musicola TaxID=2175873 RepID=A0A8H6NE42_9PEZI|nr:hypothetical protein CMUS01_08238 [Colletotrichum musicola]